MELEVFLTVRQMVVELFSLHLERELQTPKTQVQSSKEEEATSTNETINYRQQWEEDSLMHRYQIRKL